MRVHVDPGRLRHELARRGLSATHLAREAGLSTPTITAALAGRAISATSLSLIAKALTRLPAMDVIDSLLLDDFGPREIQ
jgi:transcriptional regulator with XRE-family HTH domain